MSRSEPIEQIEHSLPIEDGCIPIKAVEVVVFLDENGDEGIGVRWQGTKNIVLELGMVEYAKKMIDDEHRRDRNSDDDYQN